MEFVKTNDYATIYLKGGGWVSGWLVSGPAPGVKVLCKASINIPGKQKHTNDNDLTSVAEDSILLMTVISDWKAEGVLDG